MGGCSIFGVLRRVRRTVGGPAFRPGNRFREFWALAPGFLIGHCTQSSAASSNGQDRALSRLGWEFDSPRCYQESSMSVNVIEVEGFQIGIAAETYCARGGDPRQLADQARADRTRLGHDVDKSAVLWICCLQAIPLKLL